MFLQKNKIMLILYEQKMAQPKYEKCIELIVFSIVSIYLLKLKTTLTFATQIIMFYKLAYQAQNPLCQCSVYILRSQLTSH